MKRKDKHLTNEYPAILGGERLVVKMTPELEKRLRAAAAPVITGPIKATPLSEMRKRIKELKKKQKKR